MGLRERIEQYIEYKEITPRELEVNSGLSNGAVSKMGDNTRRSTIDKVSIAYPDLNPTWLLTGEGEMLLTQSKEPNATLYDPPHIVEVPIIPYTARAGSLGEYEQIMDSEWETLPIPQDIIHRGKYLIFEVYGDSMLDKIQHGDKVLARLVQRHLWEDSRLHLKQWDTWVIITRSEGVLIKNIAEHNVEDRTLLLHSFNPLYEDFTISLSDVVDIYNVVELVSRKL